MRLLLDEGLPIQLLEPLRLNRPHDFEHVQGLEWKGKLDPFLFPDAAGRGFEAIVTLDVDQLTDPDLCKSLRSSGLHHLSLRQGRRVKGKTGVARVIASLVVALPYAIPDLESAPGQRIVEVALLGAEARHETFDPQRERHRYPYWP